MTNLNLEHLRQVQPRVLCLGTNRGIIQSMLDFDTLAGRTNPSIVGIVAGGRKHERYFLGPREIMLPVYANLELVPEDVRTGVNLFLNVTSGRRVLSSSLQALGLLPNLVGGVVFAEGFPEQHAIQLYRAATDAGVWLLGGASVGLVLPRVLKLGAIGGTQAMQLEQSRLFTPGSVAVISSSGGMVNEIIRAVARSGQALSFALALGGERFPLTTPREAFEAAEADPATMAIAYFGELGGDDEYLLADMMRTGAVTKPVIAVVAGVVAELFDTPPQFGHAKAMAVREDESARAKRAALGAAGAHVADSFSEFVAALGALPNPLPPSGKSGETTAETAPAPAARPAAPPARRAAPFATTISGDAGDVVQVLGRDLLDLAEQQSFAHIAVSMFLGRAIRSAELEQFVDFVLRLLVDHGPYVSGAVNTMVAARAGKDLVSSLAAGLLTIGPRFGGATGQAAGIWLDGVTSGRPAVALVEEFARRRQTIAGIGHRKYRIDVPDPRVRRLLQFTGGLKSARFTTFAREVEAETVRKKGNLILNVDGAIAAIALDLLSEKEGYSDAQLATLADTGFFDALFVLSRSVGFIAHYFDQVRLDEGLFRLSPADVAQINPTDLVV